MTRKKIGCLLGMFGALGVLYALLFVVSPIIGENHKRHGAHDVVTALLNQQGNLDEVVQRSGFPIAMTKVSRQDVKLLAEMNGWDFPGEANLSFHRLAVPGLKDFSGYIAYKSEDERILWVEIEDRKMPAARITPDKGR